MKKFISLLAQYVVFLGLGLFLIWWSVRSLSDADMRSLRESLGVANYLLIVPAMGMLMLAHYSRALRWRIMMEPLGFQPSRSNTFIAVLLGYFFNLLVPRMGEVMKCTTLARYERTPVDRLIGTMVAERALDVLCLLTVFGLAFLSQMKTVCSRNSVLRRMRRMLVNPCQTPSARARTRAMTPTCRNLRTRM